MIDLNILIVEDNEDDALLLLNELRYGGYKVTKYLVIQTEEQLNYALNENIKWDIVISDYTMPGFNGLQALLMVKRFDGDLPFILISGMIGEETAVAALKAGANDYLLKDRLSRLPKAIQKELDDAKQRRQLQETQKQLSEAKALAELANHRKSQVLAFVAHEFKNPLQAITLFSDLLIDNIYGEMNTKQKESINNIKMATQHLKTLVSDILDIAAIEAGKIRLNLTEFNIVDTLKESILLNNEHATRSLIKIQLDTKSEKMIFTGDERRLKQVFINIISNAVKYSLANTKIIVTADISPSLLTVLVTDEGIGISEVDLNELFKAFYRVDNRLGTQPEGVGLGLALTKTLIELHDGSIDVESELNKGTCFKVMLPIR